MSRPQVRTAVLAVVAALVAAVGAPALAAVLARSVASTQPTAGAWGAAAGPVGGPATRGDYVVRFPQGTPIPPQYFELFNTGTLRLTGQTYKAVNVRPLNGNAPPTVTLDACVGGRWETTTSVCLGGTVQTLTSTDVPSSTVTLALPVGAVVHVRAAPSRLANYPLEYQTVVTVTVARSQAAAGRTVSS
jgi:hypothetical protein